MNARERIAEALVVAAGRQSDFNEWLLADAVLAVLPALFADERVLDAATMAIWQSGYDVRAEASNALDAAVKTLQAGDAA